jgi:hypothetical protein
MVPVSSISSKEIDSARSPAGFFFAPMLAAKTKKPPALANRRLSGFWW